MINFLAKLFIAAAAAPANALLPTNTLPPITLIPAELSGRISDALKWVPTLLFGFAGGIAIIFLLVGAVRYITASGNQDLLGRAKSTIIYSIMGLIIMIIAWVIVSFILGTFAPPLKVEKPAIVPQFNP